MVTKAFCLMSRRPANMIRPIAPVLFLVASAVPLGNATAQDLAEGGGEKSQVQQIYEDGVQQFSDGEYEAAAQSFSTLITAAESQTQYDPRLYLVRAKAFAQLEEYEAALEDLKNALTYGQSAPALLPEIQNTRGEIYMELGGFQQALPDLQAATQADRSNPQYQFNLGKSLVKLGGADPGEKALTRYLEAVVDGEEEQRAEALQLRGMAYGMLRKNDKAMEDFAASLEITPDDHETYFGRAQVQLGDNNYEAAIEDLKLAIENYTPEDEEDETPYLQAYLSLASAYEEVGKEAYDPEPALEAYRAGVQACQELLDDLPEENQAFAGARAATLFRRGVLERLLGELGMAVKSFSQALQINPILGEAYFRRGICFHYLGEEKLAIRDFEQAASIDFDSPRANLWRGMSWARLGDFNEAIAAYGDSVAVSDRYTPAYVNRGLAHLQQADYTKAVADFNEAIRLDPTNALHYYRRGRAYSLSGESDKAIQSLMNAIAFNNRLGPAYTALADELETAGQEALATEYRRQAAQLEQ